MCKSVWPSWSACLTITVMFLYHLVWMHVQKNRSSTAWPIHELLSCAVASWRPELLRLTGEKLLTVKETCTLLTTLPDASVCTDTGSKTRRWTTVVVVVIVVVVVLAGCVLLLWKCWRRIKGEAILHIWDSFKSVAQWIFQSISLRSSSLFMPSVFILCRETWHCWK